VSNVEMRIKKKQFIKDTKNFNPDEKIVFLLEKVLNIENKLIDLAKKFQNHAFYGE
jgi:hypothetical protein